MIELRLIGMMELRRDGAAVPLPPSRKTRALLAYLAATGRQQSRERLCELLWEGPDDPRAQLRWSLARLRPLLGDALVTSRERVELSHDQTRLDLTSICTASSATTTALEQCATLYRGEFLEGLELPHCFRFQQWCAGERERVRQAHVQVLTELIERLKGQPAALDYAQRRVEIDPFNDEAHARLIRLLADGGNQHEALRQYERSRRLFERELATRTPGVIEEARRRIGRAARPPRASPVVAARTPLVGRRAEIESIRSNRDAILIVGEPGIGKSRLLEELTSGAAIGASLYARCFAAEMVRPYGPWVDLLGDLPPENDRAQLFDAVVERLAAVDLVALDDLQWIDEASAALLHYAIRKGATRFVLAARPGEIDDNRHAVYLQRGLRLATIPLGPLSLDETMELVNDRKIAELSEGIPLFALELVRSGSPGGALQSVIASRLDHLDGAARELVGWAAAIGRGFDAELVGRATAMPAGEMLAALERLERSAIIRAAGEQRYDFTHDLIRDAAYQSVTGPRRLLIHRHIARALQEAHDTEGTLAGEILHHASLAGDHSAAAAAALTAGKRCLRMFAYSEATRVARRGLQIAAELTGSERIEIEMQLMHLIVMSRTPIGERLVWAGRIAELTELAHRTGKHASASLGAHLLACLHEESNDYSGAARATIRSAEVSRAADPATAALSMAISARCLLTLQRETARAADLVRQAEAMAIPNHELSLASGFLHAHYGRTDEAIRRLEDALSLASAGEDHWREWIALTKMITISLEEDDVHRAADCCSRLHPIASKMQGGSEEARSSVLESLAALAAGAAVDLDQVLSTLRNIDSKSDLAWTLSWLALRATDGEMRRRFATEALEAADAVGRVSEAAIARCLLGLPVRSSPDLSARAKRIIKESRHGNSRTRTVVRSADHP
jgi:DNA-binding SARP family transcriptional activator/tetratricopeptide (TPR) repeat protein